jgi:hypothetical protein
METEKSLLAYNSQDRCCVLPLQEATAVLDCLWDNAFRYSEHGL